VSFVEGVDFGVWGVSYMWGWYGSFRLIALSFFLDFDSIVVEPLFFLAEHAVHSTPFWRGG
jgi:hypothetical protein